MSSSGCDTFVEGTLFPRIGELIASATTFCSIDTKMVQSKSLSSRVHRYICGTGFISEIGEFVPHPISLFMTSLNDVISRNFKRFQIPLMLFDSPNTYRSLKEFWIIRRFVHLENDIVPFESICRFVINVQFYNNLTPLPD